MQCKSLDLQFEKLLNDWPYQKCGVLHACYLPSSDLRSYGDMALGVEAVL